MFFLVWFHTDVRPVMQDYTCVQTPTFSLPLSIRTYKSGS